MGLVDDAGLILDDLVALRRRIHQHPELGLHLPRTQAAILEALDGLPLEITAGRELSSVVAVLRGGARSPGLDPAGRRPAVLLRGDMDGLPVMEDSGEEFASTTGTMHACGHDLHVAGLVGAARLLSARTDELAGDVVFMFQPGEERPGGALPMIEEGVLKAAGGTVDAAFGLHVSGLYDRGLFLSKAGAAWAGSNVLRVTVRGRGGHASSPWMSVDPIPVAAEIVRDRVVERPHPIMGAEDFSYVLEKVPAATSCSARDRTTSPPRAHRRTTPPSSGSTTRYSATKPRHWQN